MRKLYFEDDILSEPPEDTNYTLNAVFGYTSNMDTFNIIKGNVNDFVIYTNQIGILEKAKDFWNDNHFEIYLRDSKRNWTNIHKLTNRKLNPVLSIKTLYIAGEFNNWRKHNENSWND